MKILKFSVHPVSLITKDGRQLVKLDFVSDFTGHIDLCAYENERMIGEADVAVASGEYGTEVLLPCAKEDKMIRFELSKKNGELLYCTEVMWKKPREWTFYVMLSSHFDIGLHEPQYVQRDASEKTIDAAIALSDATADSPEETQYRYTMEGRWFWENYPSDRGTEAAEKVLRDYIRPGKMGLCCGIAGNHTNVFGFEELCRSTYGREKILHDWKVDSHTMSMIDVNGMSWAMVEPYVDAGYKNMIFCPNHWNPLDSTVWHYDTTKEGHYWNPNAGGAGARCDVRYDSTIPMLYYWESASSHKKMLVWASTHYGFGGDEFGFNYQCRLNTPALHKMKDKFSHRLPKMEERYPYDIWLLADYGDNEEPNLWQVELFSAWNEIWEYPKIRTLGNPDVPFDMVRERFGDQIPTIRGEMIGGWYQHPVAAPQLLADKLLTDRRLAVAETYASLASLYGNYRYPAQEFSRAWEYLLWNDEHSYGTSGYQGRRVYETWMQHRDWLEKAAKTADTEAGAALDALAAEIPANEDSLVVFNPTAHIRTERVYYGKSTAVVTDIPACGYKVFPLSALSEEQEQVQRCTCPPTVENDHYRIVFAQDGSMRSIYDKMVGRELLEHEKYGANCLVYTQDNHRTFVTPENAIFTVVQKNGVIKVIAEMEEPHSGAGIVQTVVLDNLYHHIDIDNRLTHIHSMVNKHRYQRYLYYAFPFAVPGARRICQLNGCEAEYAVDLTGHGTDTYMSAHEWAVSENDTFGAALLQRDSLLVEFDHIHPDKTDCGAAGEGSAIYSYVSNDWLQMHEVGGSHVDLHLRYRITSWNGSYRDAGLRKMAEEFVNPVDVRKIAVQGGSLSAKENSFLQIPESRRLLCLKRAEDGNGVIARLYGEGEAKIEMGGHSYTYCTVDERPTENQSDTDLFVTLRINTDPLPLRADTPDWSDEEKPAPIGSVWTGLITEPCAAPGERDGHLYLLWGKNMEKNLSHYELYRSEVSGFIPSEETFVARVEPEEYRVDRYVDDGLKIHTEYFYRVRAVNTDGICGEFSKEFSAFTKEPITEA